MGKQRFEQDRASVLVFAAIGIASLLVRTASAQVTLRVSVDSSGAQSNGGSSGSSISKDGRFVAFQSAASNLVPSDLNGRMDIFVRDLQNATTERVSVATGGAEGNLDSQSPFISADGRYVVFDSLATNLVAGDTNGMWDVFLHDRLNHTTERIDLSSTGGQADLGARTGSISADGRFAVFSSNATNLVPNDTNAASDVFVRDLLLGTTELASVATGGLPGNGPSLQGLISADGRSVAFESLATNLVTPNTQPCTQVYVHDRLTGITDRSSLSTSGLEADLDCWLSSISTDGRYLVLYSAADDLVPFDTNSCFDTFIRDRQTGVTDLVSIDSDGTAGNQDSLQGESSDDGRFVAFVTRSSNFGPVDTNFVADVYVRDRLQGLTDRASVSSQWAQSDHDCSAPSLSGDGRYVVFSSVSSRLVRIDTNGLADVFLRDREYAPFQRFCSPGLGGVAPCPCTLPASTPGTGCNNSFHTGGALLEAAGVAYLSMDSLTFSASAEPWFALNVLVQGTGTVPGGVVLGQGVHCVGGTLNRLYVKSAFYGAMSAPDTGDLAVSDRSAALGDVIQAGQSRYYTMLYRDPVVPAGCPPTSTLNATETGVVVWSP